MGKKFWIFILLGLLIISTETISLCYLVKTDTSKFDNSEQIVTEYFAFLSEGRYEDLYQFVELPTGYDKEKFIQRNKNIYEGIDASNIEMKIQSTIEEKNSIKVEYINTMNTKGGMVSFKNVATVIKNKDKQYKIKWSSNLIFPELNDDYKVRVISLEAERGDLIDRNGALLATERKVYKVGIVPGKLGENKEENLAKIAELLGMTVESINNYLSAPWVADGSFVPIKKIPYDSVELKADLLQIPGVMMDTDVIRVYPYRDYTSHITGYIQGISAEELEELKDKGYTSDSLIGKDGLERVYEDRLRGIDGLRIYIEDDRGNEVKQIAGIAPQNGENIRLTIDINLQVKIFDLIKDDEGFFVVMDPTTGELLALVSAPSYDVNKFITGMTNEEWEALSNSPLKPLYTRFLGSWCPGSTMKPLTGGIGLTSGMLKTTDTFYYYGLSWRKNKSWKNNSITTLTAYKGKKNLRNALIYSDNIYFAQATLKIGEETFRTGLDKLKFNQNIGFDMPTAKSQYSNTDTIQGEVTLANSGYGQGEVLVNPIHMASIYSAFMNDGNMVKPYIEYKENAYAEYLVEGAFSKEAADEIKEGLIQAVENPGGTGHDVKIQGLTIAGKTGTAELKATKEEKGDILGWFNCFTPDENLQNPILIISMLRNKQPKEIKAKVKAIFAQ